MVVLTLTDEQAERLSQVLWEVAGEGPLGSGEAAEKVVRLRELVDAEIKKQKEP